MQAATVEPPTELRLNVSRRDAARDIQAQVKMGQAIRGQRIRDMRDLDEARREKQEWVQRTIDLLGKLISHATFVEQFNDFVPTILPEFAEMQMFVDVFDEEMRYRVGRLQTFVKAVSTLPEPAPVPPTPHPEMVPTIADVLDTAMSQQPLPASSNVTSTPAPATAPAHEATAPASKARTAEAGITGLMICRGEDGELRGSISDFMRKLGIDLRMVEHAAIGDALQHRGGASFVVFAGEVPDDQSPNSAFELGCFAGRFGTDRLIIVHRGSVANANADRFGIARIGVDSSDGWQLQLARLLRKANIQLDLNRLLI